MIETPAKNAAAPRISFVSLGCPKALVDSERILTRLRADGYAMSADYAGADVVLVNTCGFLDSAKEESLAAIGEAIAENGRVIVTGCMGNEAEAIRARFPSVLAVTGAHQYEDVVTAVHEAAPPSRGPFVDLIPQPSETDIKLTPRHYSYLKISEGCNHACAFCIIPQLRGPLVSRRIDAVLREAEKLVAAGTRELLVISQDTSAYGVDTRHEARDWHGSPVRAHMTDLARELGQLRTPQGAAPWVRPGHKIWLHDGPGTVFAIVTLDSNRWRIVYECAHTCLRLALRLRHRLPLLRPVLGQQGAGAEKRTHHSGSQVC